MSNSTPKNYATAKYLIYNCWGENVPRKGGCEIRGSNLLDCADTEEVANIMVNMYKLRYEANGSTEGNRLVVVKNDPVWWTKQQTPPQANSDLGTSGASLAE